MGIYGGVFVFFSDEEQLTDLTISPKARWQVGHKIVDIPYNGKVFPAFTEILRYTSPNRARRTEAVSFYILS